jgi:O-antigen/teichoic acid export membrane protein
MIDDRLIRNALMAVLQALISGAVLFFLFRYLLKTIGAEQVGVWSIVLASASVAKISEMGFSGCAVKFTAKYIASGDRKRASEVIQTTIITIGVLLVVIFAGGYQVIAWALGRMMQGHSLDSAVLLLPYALISMWIASISGVLLSGLDGCQCVNLRASISIFGSLVLLLLVWLMVPTHGLIGLAWAQIGQGIFMLIGGWVFLRRQMPSLPQIKFKWSYPLFREMLNYGFNFQVISFFSILFDPLTKVLMAKFGGLTSVAYYEMANRMVTQFRSLLVSANQVMVPKTAELHEESPEKIQNIYMYCYRAMVFISTPLFSGVAAIAPLVSEVWIGRYEPQFIFYVYVLCGAYWINTLTVPAYFIFMGTGKMRWNSISHILIAFLNITIGYILGIFIGGYGVALGYALALIIGSCSIIFGYHFENNNRFGIFFPKESRYLLIVSIIGLVAGWIAFSFMPQDVNTTLKALIILVIFSISISPIIWIHPLIGKIKLRLY